MGIKNDLQKNAKERKNYARKKYHEKNPTLIKIKSVRFFTLKFSFAKCYKCHLCFILGIPGPNH